MAYGITDQGFIKKTYAVILAEMQTELRKAPPEGLGENVDLSINIIKTKSTTRRESVSIGRQDSVISQGRPRFNLS
jgi:hypothetical protein